MAESLREQLRRHSICHILFSSQFVTPSHPSSSNQRAQILSETGLYLPIPCQRGQGIHQYGLQKDHGKIAQLWNVMHLTAPPSL